MAHETDANAPLRHRQASKRPQACHSRPGGRGPRRSGHDQGKPGKDGAARRRAEDGRAGRAAAGGRRAPPWTRPPLALPRLASCPRRHVSGHPARLAPVRPVPPPPATRAPARRPLTRHRHRPPAPATLSGFPGHVCSDGDRTRQGASGRSTPPRPARRHQPVSTGPDASSTRDGPQDRHEARPMARQTRGSRAQGRFHFCVVVFRGSRPGSGCALRAGSGRAMPALALPAQAAAGLWPRVPAAPVSPPHRVPV